MSRLKADEKGGELNRESFVQKSALSGLILRPVVQMIAVLNWCE